MNSEIVMHYLKARYFRTSGKDLLLDDKQMVYEKNLNERWILNQ